MDTNWKTLIIFALAALFTSFIWVIFGDQPKVAAVIFGGATFITFGSYWLTLLKDVVTSSTKQGERLMKFIGRLAIGSILFAAVVALLAGLLEVAFKPLFDKVAAGSYSDLLNPAAYSNQVMIVVLSAIIAYGLVVPVTRWLVLMVAGVVCLGCLVVPLLMAKNPWIGRAVKDASAATEDATEAAMVKARSGAESAKASAKREQLKQQAQDLKKDALADVEVALNSHEMILWEGTAKSPLVIEIPIDGLLSYTGQYESNEEPVTKGSKFTLKPSRDWIQNPANGHYFVPFFRNDQSAILRYFKLNDVHPFILGAIQQQKLALSASNDAKSAPSVATDSGPKIPVTSVTVAPLPISRPARSTVTSDRVVLRPAANPDDWTSTQVVAYDNETISYWPEGGRQEDVTRINVRSGDAAPLRLQPLYRAGVGYYGMVMWQGANSVSQPQRLQLTGGGTVTVTIRKE